MHIAEFLVNFETVYSRTHWKTMSDNPPITCYHVNLTHPDMSHQYRWIRDASSLYITVAQAQTKLDMFCGLVADIFSRKLDPVSKKEHSDFWLFLQQHAQVLSLCRCTSRLFPVMLSCWNRESWTKDSLMMRWKRWSQGCCKRAKAQHVLDKSWSDIQLGCLDSIVL